MLGRAQAKGLENHSIICTKDGQVGYLEKLTPDKRYYWVVVEPGLRAVEIQTSETVTVVQSTLQLAKDWMKHNK